MLYFCSISLLNKSIHVSIKMYNAQMFWLSNEVGDVLNEISAINGIDNNKKFVGHFSVSCLIGIAYLYNQF